MSEELKTLTEAQLMAMEQQYAQGFIGGQWTHRVVPQLFMAVRESFATIDALTEQVAEMTMERDECNALLHVNQDAHKRCDVLMGELGRKLTAAEKRVKELYLEWTAGEQARLQLARELLAAEATLDTLTTQLRERATRTVIGMCGECGGDLFAPVPGPGISPVFAEHECPLELVVWRTRALAAEATADRYEVALERGPEWHAKRFPTATMEHVALKLAEETGEVCAAVIALAGNEHPERAGDVMEECADVFIVLSVLVGRYFPSTPLFDAVQEKLAALSTEPVKGWRAAMGVIKLPKPSEEMIADLRGRPIEGTEVSDE